MNLIVKTKPFVFIIDDDDSIVDLLEFLLNNNGFKTAHAYNGESAIKQMQSEIPDLILLDVEMPGHWTGYETCIAIKKDAALKEIPVIFLSGGDNVNSKVEGFNVGGKDYIIKPFQKEELLIRINNQINLYHLQKNLQEEVENQTKNIYQSHLILTKAPFVIIYTDQDGIIQYINPAVYNVFNYLEGEVEGEQLLKLLPELNDIQYDHFRGSIDSGDLEMFADESQIKKSSDSYNYLERFMYGDIVDGDKYIIQTKSKDGSSIWTTVSIDKDNFRGQSSFTIIIHDVTKLKQKELEVIQINDGLEQTVKERTSELELAIAELNTKREELESLAKKLAKYLSPQVFNSIFTGEKEVKLETYRKKLTVFFSDIKDFTAITDSIDSESLTKLLNTYLNEMANIALKYGGTIDKFIGDAVMIFFGDPETRGEEEDALACVKMAIEMNQKIKQLQYYWKKQGITEKFQIRTGISTGFCTVGNFGSEDRLDYTIIGGNVNLASRLETLDIPGEVLVSQETYILTKDKIKYVKQSAINVKGMSHPVQTYQVIGYKDKHNVLEGWHEEEHDGFLLSIDFDKVPKETVINILRKTLSQCENKKD